ncbi:hypothetical protein JCM10213_008590 [Rhodosporidiobolus nylandii]
MQHHPHHAGSYDSRFREACEEVVTYLLVWHGQDPEGPTAYEWLSSVWDVMPERLWDELTVPEKNAVEHEVQSLPHRTQFATFESAPTPLKHPRLFPAIMAMRAKYAIVLARNPDDACSSDEAHSSEARRNGAAKVTGIDDYWRVRQAIQAVIDHLHMVHDEQEGMTADVWERSMRNAVRKQMWLMLDIKEKQDIVGEVAALAIDFQLKSIEDAPTFFSHPHLFRHIEEARRKYGFQNLPDAKEVSEDGYDAEPEAQGGQEQASRRSALLERAAEERRARRAAKHERRASRDAYTPESREKDHVLPWLDRSGSPRQQHDPFR